MAIKADLLLSPPAPAPGYNSASKLSVQDLEDNLNMLVFHRLPTPVPFTAASASGSSSAGERSFSREQSTLTVASDATEDSSYSKTFSFFSDVLPRLRPPQPVRAQTLADNPNSSPNYFISELEHDSSLLTPTANNKMSANDSFFFSTSLSRPTPPPSLRSGRASANSTVVSPRPKQSSLPPLERFFPSRRRGPSPPPDITPRPRDLEELNDEMDHFREECDSTPAPWEHQRLPSPSPVPSIKIPSPPSTASSIDTDEPAEPLSPPPPLEGSTIGADTNTPIKLIHQLGSGSFSSVWLAKDISGLLTHTDLTKHPKKGWRARLKSESAAKRKRDWKVRGLKPNPSAVETPIPVVESLVEIEGAGVARQRSVVLRPPSPVIERDEDNPFEENDQLVAVKMMARNLCDVDDRMRISFVREVEVLRVIVSFHSLFHFLTFHIAHLTSFYCIIPTFVHNTHTSRTCT